MDAYSTFTGVTIFVMSFLILYSAIFKKPVQIKDLGLPAPEKPRERISYMALGIILLLIASSSFLMIHFPEPKVIPIDSMESSSGWKIVREDNGTIMNGIQSTVGFKGNAIKIDYDLGVNGAVVILKRIPFASISKDISKINEISFNYTAKENLNSTHIAKGAANSLEIQLDDDERGLCFGLKIPNAANAVSWTSAKVEIKDLSCWGCGCKGNETIDLNKIDYIELAISNLDGEKGGQGEVIFDQIEGTVPASGLPSLRFRS